MLSLDRNSAAKLFHDFTGMKALVIGDVMLDSYIWGHVERISPEAPVPVVSVSKRENRLGGAANVALNLQALGAVPILCSVTGNDSRCDDFCKLLEQHDISHAGILKNEQRSTTTKFRIIGNNYQMLRVDEETTQVLNQDESRNFFNLIERIVLAENPQVIIFEDYDKGVINHALIQWVVELAEKKKIPLVVDPKKKNFLHYKRVSLFKPNFTELCEGLKIENVQKTPESLLRICSAFQYQHDIPNMMLTLSEKGMFISSADKIGKYTGEMIPARVRNIADVSGAGDTVISIAALCTALKLPLYDTAFIANIGGGLVCEHTGVVPVNKEKLKEEVLSLM